MGGFAAKGADKREVDEPALSFFLRRFMQSRRRGELSASWFARTAM
jgi:hypothetical protein